ARHDLPRHARSGLPPLLQSHASGARFRLEDQAIEPQQNDRADDAEDQTPEAADPGARRRGADAHAEDRFGDESADERADDADDGGDDETAGTLAGHDPFGNDADDKADDENPEPVQHVVPPG